MTYHSEQQLIAKIKRADKNAATQRRKSIDLQGTGRDVRVRPEFWEQVAREYRLELQQLRQPR